MTTKVSEMTKELISIFVDQLMASKRSEKRNERLKIAQSPTSHYPATRKAYRPKVPSTSRWSSLPPKVYDDNWGVKPMPPEMNSWMKAILIMAGLIGGVSGVIAGAVLAPHVMATLLVLFVLGIFCLVTKELIDDERRKKR